MRIGFRGTAALIAAASAALFSPGNASAEGLDFAGHGARGTMRGGAYVVGSDDGMALLYNPANLANTRGMQLHASVGLLMYSMCYDRDGTYGSSATGVNRGGYTNAADQYGSTAVGTGDETGLSDGAGGTLSFDDIRGTATPEVCNGHRVNVIPQLSYTWRINDRFGLGIGLVAPNAAGNVSYGSQMGGRQGMVRAGDLTLPAPSRYMLISQNALIAFPTIGLGVRVVNKIRVGASFGWGFGSITFRTVATPYYSENIATDIYSRVDLHDRFIPRVGAGISGGPWQGVSFGANFTYMGDLTAKGRIQAESMYYYDAAVRDSFVTSANVPARLNTQFPWQLTLGARYGHERRGVTLPANAVGDSLDTERWNVEFNVGYSRSSRVKDFVVHAGEARLPDGYDRSLPATDPANLALFPCPLEVDPNSDFASGCVQVSPALAAGVPDVFAPIRHNWKDQITLRVGGDYNIVPGRLSVSAGFSFDSNGQQRGYEQLDFQPYRRFGAHAGFTVRAGRVDINVAYAHHFNQSRTNTSSTACSGRVGGAGDANGDGDLFDPGEAAVCGGTTQPEWGVQPLAAVPIYRSDVANGGRFRSHLDVVQVGLSYHLR